MAKEFLRYKVTADTKDFEKGMKKVTKSSAAANKSVKKQGQTFTQLSYALDDAQYGFRGVQNNLQQIAVQAGLGGPVILGITAMIIALNYAITNWQKFGDEAQLAITKAYAGDQGAIAQTLVFAEVLKTTEAGTDANTYALKQLKKNGYDPVNQSLDEFIRLTQKKILLGAIESAGAELLAEELGNIIKKQNLITRAASGDKLAIAEIMGRGIGNLTVGFNAVNNSIGKSRDRIKELTKTMAGEVKALFGDKGFLDFLLKGKGSKDAITDYQTDLKHVLTLAKQAGATKYELAEAELAWLESLDKSNLSAKQQQAILLKMQELTQGLATGFFDAKVEIDKFEQELKGLFDSLLSAEELFIRDWHVKLSQWLAEGKITFEEFLRYLDIVDEALAKKAEKGIGERADQILNHGIANIIQSTAEAFVSGDNIGESLLSGVGSILTQLGGLLIVTGLGIEAFKESLKTLNGPVAVAAGIAMVVAGAAFASAAKKAGGGSEGSGATRSTPSSSTTTPSSVQGAGSGGELVATVRGQDLRFVLQAANDSYTALN